MKHSVVPPSSGPPSTLLLQWISYCQNSWPVVPVTQVCMCQARTHAPQASTCARTYKETHKHMHTHTTHTQSSLPHGHILGLLLFKIELLRLFLSALKPIYLFVTAGIKIVYLISYLIETAVIEKYLISKVLLLSSKSYSRTVEVPNRRSAWLMICISTFHVFAFHSLSLLLNCC